VVEGVGEGCNVLLFEMGMTEIEAVGQRSLIVLMHKGHILSIGSVRILGLSFDLFCDDEVVLGLLGVVALLQVQKLDHFLLSLCTYCLI
jgi:hypothetical protein